jgi:hypothetical protein
MGFIYGLLIGAVLAVVGEEYGIPHFDRDMFSKSACSRAAAEKCNGPHVCRYVGVQGERSLVKKEGTPCPEVVLIPWRAASYIDPRTMCRSESHLPPEPNPYGIDLSHVGDGVPGARDPANCYGWFQGQPSPFDEKPK